MTTKKTKGPTFGSKLVQWEVIEIFDNEVPKKLMKVFEQDQANADTGYVYTLMWKDCFLFHGEDGWCIGDSLITAAEKWLEKHREQHGLGERTPFWFRIKRA